MFFISTTRSRRKTFARMSTHFHQNFMSGLGSTARLVRPITRNCPQAKYPVLSFRKGDQRRQHAIVLCATLKMQTGRQNRSAMFQPIASVLQHRAEKNPQFENTNAVQDLPIIGKNAPSARLFENLTGLVHGWRYARHC